MPQRIIIHGYQRIKLDMVAARLTKPAEIERFVQRRTSDLLARSAAGV
jgi:hypothetical protein